MLVPETLAISTLQFMPITVLERGRRPRGDEVPTTNLMLLAGPAMND